MNSRTSNFLFRKLSMLLVTLSLSGMLAFAQNRTVTGTVVDANGEPIPGANVIIVGTQVGATTDFDGNFSIPNVSKNAALQVSFIGYATQRVDIAGQSQVRISLAEDRDLLDEVVVIGYGAVRRRDLTGAVASVKGDNVKQTPVANVAEALQGRLPGVNVISEDGRPGATQSIRVRGGGSITQSNDPLFVVDGLPVGNINDIPASEIESSPHQLRWLCTGQDRTEYTSDAECPGVCAPQLELCCFAWYCQCRCRGQVFRPGFAIWQPLCSVCQYGYARLYR